MQPPFLLLCVLQSLISVSCSATLKTKVNEKPDIEESQLFQLTPKVPIEQFLGNPQELQSSKNVASVPKVPIGPFLGNPQKLESSKNVGSKPNMQNQVHKNVDVIDDAEAEEEESLNDLLKTVLITLRDHPDIIMNILEDEERRRNKDFQEPPAQLVLEPKRVQKKGGYKSWGNLKAKSESSQETKENSDQSRGSRESSESRDGSYYKNKYDMSVFSGENSDDSKELDLAQYYKQKYANSKSDGSRSSSSSASSEEDEHPVVPLDKRVPEQPEETIDITSLSDGDDLDLTNLISEGGLEDLPEYKESHNKLVPEPSKVLKADRTVILEKIPKSVLSAKANGENAEPTTNALKPVITEADMSSGNIENHREAVKNPKAPANEEVEKTQARQSSEQKS
uniref:Uncharacterized protein DDB_G0286299-like isoform X1 n=1 Tax=Crassostrea virginica TaxID=6565 RepID=A0A8B8DPM4_CRAVI|nr:uncharacterized protein DDB_G0286299-like isoform X1 [Crassostrea virginica]